MIGLCREVDHLQGIIKDVRRRLRNAGHPQIRRELLHHCCEMCRERMWVAYHGTCTVGMLRRLVRLRPLCFAPGRVRPRRHRAGGRFTPRRASQRPGDPPQAPRSDHKRLNLLSASWPTEVEAQTTLISFPRRHPSGIDETQLNRLAHDGQSRRRRPSLGPNLPAPPPIGDSEGKPQGGGM